MNLARFHCAVSFIPDLRLMRRRACLDARNNSGNAHRSTITILSDAAVDTEIPIPVPIAT